MTFLASHIAAVRMNVLSLSRVDVVPRLNIVIPLSLPKSRAGDRPVSGGALQCECEMQSDDVLSCEDEIFCFWPSPND